MQLLDQRSLTVGQLGAAWAIAVDAVVGVTPDLAIGVSHSAAALGEPRDGGGWCIDSTAHDCDGLYAGGVLDARWRMPGAAAITGVVRLGVAAGWSPMARLGVVARGTQRHLWWRIAPEVGVALDRADDDRDALGVPAWLGVDLGGGSAWLTTGVRGELAGFADAAVVPLGVGAEGRYRGVAIGASVGYPQLLGRHASTRVRTMAWWVGWGW